MVVILSHHKVCQLILAELAEGGEMTRIPNARPAVVIHRGGRFLPAENEEAIHGRSDDLYILMKNQKSRVSRATVYKTLELLANCELLSKRNFGDNMTRYESSYKRQNHDHLICMDCGRIVEFVDQNVKKIPEEISNKLGFDVESYSFNIFARCKNIKTCKYYKQR